MDPSKRACWLKGLGAALLVAGVLVAPNDDLRLALAGIVALAVGGWLYCAGLAQEEMRPKR